MKTIIKLLFLFLSFATLSACQEQEQQSELASVSDSEHNHRDNQLSATDKVLLLPKGDFEPLRKKLLNKPKLVALTDEEGIRALKIRLKNNCLYSKHIDPVDTYPCILDYKTDEERFEIAQNYSFGIMKDILEPILTISKKNAFINKEDDYLCDSNITIGTNTFSVCQLGKVKNGNSVHMGFYTPNFTVEKAQLTSIVLTMEADYLLESTSLQNEIIEVSQILLNENNKIPIKKIKNTILFSMAKGVQTIKETEYLPKDEFYNLGNDTIMHIDWLNHFSSKNNLPKIRITYFKVS